MVSRIETGIKWESGLKHTPVRAVGKARETVLVHYEEENVGALSSILSFHSNLLLRVPWPDSGPDWTGCRTGNSASHNEASYSILLRRVAKVFQDREFRVFFGVFCVFYGYAVRCRLRRRSDLNTTKPSYRGKMLRHAWYMTFQLAEVAIPRRLY